MNNLETKILLYDTLTRERCLLAAADGSSLSYYCCGPTVYGPAHIGNFRSFVLQDLLRRTIEAEGLAVKHVRNITDVDDKTIKGAQLAGESLEAFTARWVSKFHQDCRQLNLLPPEHEISAVAEIPRQIELISKLLESGHAYLAKDGSVYFDVSSFSAYGSLSRLDQRELKQGAAESGRHSVDEYSKEAAADFALWKARQLQDGENYWSSPWGEGRPGWHTECAAISMEYLGPSFDLHAGGMDLVFPHHDNEIAQAQCATGSHFARHWFHTAHLMVEDTKMSKSLGNLFTLADVIERGFSPLELRYLLMSGHYRQPLNFTWQSLNAASKAVQRLTKLQQRLLSLPVAEENRSASEFSEVFAALHDDLNTPRALGALFTVVKQVESLPDAELSKAAAGYQQVLQVLGLEGLAGQGSMEVEVPVDIKELAERRWQAKQARDWKEADSLRERLLGAGWEVKDSRDDYQLFRLAKSDSQV